MSSVYGPALLKAADFEENVEFAGGKAKKLDDFETDADRSKRIRKERKAAKEKTREIDQKQQMSKAIGTALGKDTVAAGRFASFGPSVGVGPSVGPAVGPSVGPDIGAGPPVGPTGTEVAQDEATAEASKPASASSSGPSRPRGPSGPARPPPEFQKEQEPEEPTAPSAASAQPKMVMGHLDILKDQKRVSWDELKERLANQDSGTRQEGMPGSKAFENYSDKLEKSRSERLQQQEEDTKKTLKRMAAAGGAAIKKHKKDKKKEKKGPKRTADGAVLAASSDDDEEEEDCLLARYKNK